MTSPLNWRSDMTQLNSWRRYELIRCVSSRRVLVITVTFSRLSARNVINDPTAAALYVAFEEFDRDDTASMAVS